MSGTIQATSPVRLRLPPPTLMRVVNPLVRRMLRTRLLGGRMRIPALLEFDGRRTGRRLRVPAGLHDIDGAGLVFTTRPWRRNFAGGAPVTVTHRGTSRPASARLLAATPDEVGRALRTALDRGATPFQLGLKVRRGYDPSAADLAALPLSLIRIDFAN
jgi:hypothetical protein